MARCEAEKTAIPTCDVSLRPEVPVEAPTSEALPVCYAVSAGEVVAKNVLAPDAEVQPSGSSTTTVGVVEGEPAPESMPPPAKRSIVEGLSAPSAAPAVMPKSRKRLSANPDAAKKGKCVEAGPLPTRASGSGLASRQRAKFVSLIEGMISECGSEVERLAKELEESREKSSQLERKLKVIEDAHSLEAARFESWIGELERDLGKTASSLLKAKEAKTAKSSELRCLKRKIKSGEESSVSAIGEAKEAMRAENLALARVEGWTNEGGTNEVGEAPQSPRVEGAMLPVRRGELVGAEGYFDLIFADLKSECDLSSCSSEPVGQDLVAGDAGGSVALNPEGVREDYELSSRRLTLCELLYLVFDTMPRDVRDQCAGFRIRRRSNHGFMGCDDYFDLRFPYRFRPDSVPL
ncbi:hypothetical protein DY000_02016352 [Brassica cretica]|uniref:Uncharacterized protein n=1 Tax=Brassica cretica TaxID=69181 RepID=A0ABQ7CME8_BRACR|nr:hypothetical protein DY000_02016352 [Brassica cretica]